MLRVAGNLSVVQQYLAARRSHVHPAEASETIIEKIAAGQFGDMVKAVVDVKKGIIAVAGELHADEEALLLKSGSSQEDLWGINIYPGISGDD